MADEGQAVFEQAIDQMYKSSRKTVTVGSETQFALGAKLYVTGGVNGNISVGVQANLHIGPLMELSLSAAFRKNKGPVYEFSDVSTFGKYSSKVESVEGTLKREVKEGQEEIIKTLQQDIHKFDQIVHSLTSEITEMKQKIERYEAKLGAVRLEIARDATVKVDGGFILSAGGTGQNESKLPLEIDMRNSVELAHGENSLRVERQGVKVKRAFSAGVRNLVVEE